MRGEFTKVVINKNIKIIIYENIDLIRITNDNSNNVWSS